MTDVRMLTITQPWASLIAFGAKTIETRSWRTPYRGLVAVHAARTFPRGTSRSFCARLCESPPFAAALERAGRTFAELPRGAIVAVAHLVDVVPMIGRDGRVAPEQADLTARLVARGSEKFFGDYSPGRFAWLLDGVVALAEPFVYEGRLGLTRLPDDVAARLLTAEAVTVP